MAPPRPVKRPDESEEAYQTRLKAWQQQLEQERMEQQAGRRAEGQAFVREREKAKSVGGKALAREESRERAMQTEMAAERGARIEAITEPAKPEAEIFLREEAMPTEPRELVEPAFTREGLTQIALAGEAQRKTKRYEDFINKEAQTRINKLSGNDPFTKLKITELKLKRDLAGEILKTIDGSLIVIRAGAEIVGDVPFVGDLITGIVGNRKEVVDNVKSSLEAKNEMATSISSDVRDGNLHPADGFKALDTLEKQANEAESIIQEEAILSPAVRRSGDLEDIQTDILELRQEIFRARNEIALATVTGEFDPDRGIFRLEELKGGV